jgi:hypothetical protein
MIKKIGLWALLCTWAILLVVLGLAYWNERTVNDARERHLIKELRLNNELMSETTRLRPLWTEMLKELKATQGVILIEIAEAKNSRDEFFRTQEQKLDKLIGVKK